MQLVYFSMKFILCIITLSAALLTHSASLQIQVQPSNQQPPPPTPPPPPAKKVEVEVSLPPLPRKLRFTDKATVVEQEGNNNQNASPSNNKPILHKQEKGHLPNVQTVQVEQVQRSRQEWTPSTEREEEDEDTTVFFTMDYTKVRRRRPIHNKSVSP